MRVQASLDWYCNLYDVAKGGAEGKNCRYCQIYAPTTREYVSIGSKTIVLGKPLTPREWLQGFHLIRPKTDRIIFDLTGGEPTLYAGLVEFLEGIRSYADWALTSNTLLRSRIERIFAANIDPPKCWTGSWHPAAGRSLDEFVDTLRFIRSHGVETSATIVLHESTKDRIKADLARFIDEGFRVQIHAALMEGYSVKGDSAELRALYDELKWLNRSPTEDWDVSPVGPVRDCVAGRDSISVSSDGAIYLCYRHMSNEPVPPIGKWGTWVPRTDIVHGCDWKCVYACDIVSVIGANPRLWRGETRPQREFRV